MGQRSRRKNMSIMPPISEMPLLVEPNQVTLSYSTPGWCLALLLSLACSGAFIVLNQGRRLSGVGKAQIRSIPQHSLLFDDGTLFVRQSEEPLCNVLSPSRRLHTRIRRLHLHLESCNDSTIHLDEYFKARMLADAAQVPFTMTCERQKQDSLLSRLVNDSDQPGPVPMDKYGRAWTTTELCETGNQVLHLFRQQIVDILNHVVPVKTNADIAIQFDSTIPSATYVEMISEKQFEHGTLESIVVIGPRSQELVQQIEVAFPDVEVEAFLDEDLNLLALYGWLMYANVASVCSTPSLCGYTMLSGVGGFLNQDNCPRWISRILEEDSSKVELFRVRPSKSS